jgi:hypothetical protein
MYAGSNSTAIVGGSIADGPWGTTLAGFTLQRITGELVVTEPDGKQVRVAFRQGVVVGAASPFAADSAVRIAMTERLISSSQTAGITKRIAAQPRRDEVDIVVETARLSVEHGVRLRRRVILQRTARTFSIDRGSYRFEEITLPVITGIDVDICGAIYHGIHQFMSEQRLAQDVRRLGSRFAIHPQADLTRFGFTPFERPILESLESGASMPELDARHRDIPVRTQLAVVYALVACNAAAVVEASPALAATPIEIDVPRRASVTDLASRTRTTTWKAPAAEPRTTTIDPVAVPRTITPRRNTFEVLQTIAAGKALLAAEADHYALLRVPADAQVDAIRSAYVAYACQLHRDKLPPLDLATTHDAQRLWAAINIAFGTLSDPERRAAYDASLRAAKANPEDNATLADRAFQRGLMALKREDLDTAIEQLARAAELAPNDVDYPAMLAWARFCRATDKRAVAMVTRRALERAVQKSPSPMTAHFYLGRVERILGRVADALYHFHEVLEREPGHADAATEIRMLEARVANRR